MKKWLYSLNDISIESHIEFIGGLQFCRDRQYLLVKKNNKHIGVVDFTSIDFYKRQCYFGLYANPFEKITGIGRILEEVCLKYVFNIIGLNKIKLEIFDSNVSVINLHKKFKFKETSIKDINDKKAICMELIK